MIPYKSRSGKRSGVIGYEIGKGFISVWFAKNKKYTYSTRKNSEKIIQHLQGLALDSMGLSGFIGSNKDILRED